MKQTVYKNDFIRAFEEMDRKSNFTYPGLEALYDYFEALEEDMGEEVELDVIAICCSYTQYESLEEYNQDYRPVDSIEDIEDKTIVIRVGDKSFIIENY